MEQEWTRQVRIYLSEEFAEAARKNPSDEKLKPLMDVLEKHDATLKCQFDAFAGYVHEAEQAIDSVKGTPQEAAMRQRYFLYEWTKDTIENPVKKEKYSKEFTVYVKGRETYEAATANAIEADINKLVDGENITRVRNRDSNPANNPQMPKKYHG